MTVHEGNALNLIYYIYGEPRGKDAELDLFRRVHSIELYDAIFDINDGLDAFSSVVSSIASKKKSRFSDNELESILWISVALSPIFHILDRMNKNVRPTRSGRLKTVFDLSSEAKKYWGLRLDELSMHWVRRQNFIRGLSIKRIIDPKHDVRLLKPYDDCRLQALGARHETLSLDNLGDYITNSEWGPELWENTDSRLTLKTDEELEVASCQYIDNHPNYVFVGEKDWFGGLLLDIEYIDCFSMVAKKEGLPINDLPQYKLAQIFIGEPNPFAPEKSTDNHEKLTSLIFAMDTKDADEILDILLGCNCGRMHIPDSNSRKMFIEVIDAFCYSMRHFDRKVLSALFITVTTYVEMASYLYDSLSCPTCHRVRDAEIVVESIRKVNKMDDEDLVNGFLMANFIGLSDGDDGISLRDIRWLGENYRNLLPRYANQITCGALDIDHYRFLLSSPSALTDGVI